MKPKLTFLLALTFLFLFSGSSTSSSLVSLVSTEKADPPIPVIGSHFYVGTRDLVNDKFIWRDLTQRVYSIGVGPTYFRNHQTLLFYYRS